MSGHPAASRRSLWATLALGLVFAVPALIGMARHSFWLDEVITLYPLPAGHANLGELLRNFHLASGSVSFTPFFGLVSALWASVCPGSEFALRLINLPVVLAFAWVAWQWTRACEPASRARQWALIALMAGSPFFIYYSYDFRPYAMLTLAGGMIATGLLLLEDSPRRALWLCCGGITLAWATQPTAVVLVPWLTAVIAWARRKEFALLLRQALWPAIVCGIPAVLFGLYYVVVYKTGQMVSFGAKPTLANLAFALYEFFGFLGVGPTREQLRVLAPPPGRVPTLLIDLKPTTADLLPAAVGAVIWGLVVLLVVLELRRSRGSGVSRGAGLWRVALFGLGGMALLVVFFRLKEYRYLARHISFMFVPICWPLLTLLVQAAASRSRNWAVVALVAGFQLWSSAQLLFAPAYGRDDMRGAIQAAKARVEAKEAAAIFMYGGWQAALFYGDEKEIGILSKDEILSGRRTGTGQHATQRAGSVRELADRGIRFWCLGDQGPELQKQLLQIYAGKTVAMVTLRGTECDVSGMILPLMRDSTIKPASLGRFPFIEVFHVGIPPQSKPGP